MDSRQAALDYVFSNRLSKTFEAKLSDTVNVSVFTKLPFILHEIWEFIFVYKEGLDATGQIDELLKSLPKLSSVVAEQTFVQSKFRNATRKLKAEMLIKGFLIKISVVRCANY